MSDQPKYVVLAATTTPEAAWAEADDYGFPCGVYALTPVPRPGPPRPTKMIQQATYHYRDGHVRRVDDGGLQWFALPASILAAADLIRETEAWERERGGGA